MPHIPNTPDRHAIRIPDGSIVYRHVYFRANGKPERGFIVLRGVHRKVKLAPEDPKASYWVDVESEHRQRIWAGE